MNYRNFCFYNKNYISKENLNTNIVFTSYYKEYFNTLVLGEWKCNKNILISDGNYVKFDMNIPLKESIYMVDLLYDATTYDTSFNGIIRLIDISNKNDIVKEMRTSYDIECLNKSFYIINYTEKDNILKNTKDGESLALHNNDSEENSAIVDIPGLSSPVIYIPNIKNKAKIQTVYGYDSNKTIKSINFYIDLDIKSRKKVIDNENI